MTLINDPKTVLSKGTFTQQQWTKYRKVFPLHFLKSFLYVHTQIHKKDCTPGQYYSRKPIDGTRNMHAHNVTEFTNVCLYSLHRDNNGIVFKNLHFESRFQKFAFLGCQNAVAV